MKKPLFNAAAIVGQDSIQVLEKEDGTFQIINTTAHGYKFHMRDVPRDLFFALLGECNKTAEEIAKEEPESTFSLSISK